MAKGKSNVPACRSKVRLAFPKNRPIQIRFKPPGSNNESRLSTGTYDPEKAESVAEEVKAKLLLGIDPRPTKDDSGDEMLWSEFRDHYFDLKQFRSANTKSSTENRLDVCERLLDVKYLREAMNPARLAKCQQALLAAGRTPHTVKSYMATLQAALNWAHGLGWVPERVKFELISTNQLSGMKGRALTETEYLSMLSLCDVERRTNPESWKSLLRGLWHSGLRLSEALLMSWDLPDTITPKLHRSGNVLLEIPAACQKNKKDEVIPVTPEFASIMNEVPLEDRTGWIFNPAKVRGQGATRDPRYVGKVISTIGKAAEIFVNSNGKPASAHDLRRSFGQRLADAGVLPRDLQAIMRHSELRTTERYYIKHDVAKQASRISAVLGTVLGTPVKNDNSQGQPERTETSS